MIAKFKMAAKSKMAAIDKEMHFRTNELLTWHYTLVGITI
jgi:hypothetical protein